MSGLAGFTINKPYNNTFSNNSFDTDNIKDYKNILDKMITKIIHRGPDCLDNFTDSNINIAFCGLNTKSGIASINNVTAVIDGQIDNHSELIKILSDNTNSNPQLLNEKNFNAEMSDAELLARLYIRYKTDLISKLNGSFAFVIYDNITNEIFGARDHFGIKPLYYSHIDGSLVFASEIKSILEFPGYKKDLNEAALESYLTFRYSVLEETFFKGIFKLMPAHFFLYKNGSIKISRYHEFKYEADTAKNAEEWADTVEAVLKQSITADCNNYNSNSTNENSDNQNNNASSIPAILSDNTDSPYIAALCGNDSCYFTSFDFDNYSNIEHMQTLCDKLQADNYSRIYSTNDYWNALQDVQYLMEEPVADNFAVTAYFTYRHVSEHTKSALCADGANELFGGNNIYREPFDVAVFNGLPDSIKNSFAKYSKNFPDNSKGRKFIKRTERSLESRYIGNLYAFSDKERKKLLKNKTASPKSYEITAPLYKKVNSSDSVTKMQYIDINLRLAQDILNINDKMSMTNSLELKFPFLKLNVFETARHIPVEYRVNSQNTKYALRLAAKRHIHSNLNDFKAGSNPPVRAWLKDEKYYNLIKSAFISDNAAKFFNTDILQKYLTEHKTGKADNSRKIMTVYLFLLWYREYFNR